MNLIMRLCAKTIHKFKTKLNAEGNRDGTTSAKDWLFPIHHNYPMYQLDIFFLPKVRSNKIFLQSHPP